MATSGLRFHTRMQRARKKITADHIEGKIENFLLEGKENRNKNARATVMVLLLLLCTVLAGTTWLSQNTLQEKKNSSTCLTRRENSFGNNAKA